MAKHGLANDKAKSILIVGAGASGIKLAHTLWKHSQSNKNCPRIGNILILEANDYIGGRVRSFQFEGHTVEMGANWISGRETAFDNPIWKLAKQIVLKGHSSDAREDPEQLHVVDITGEAPSVVTGQYLEQVKRFDDIFAESVKQVQKPTSTLSYQNDTDVRSILEQYGWTPKTKLTNLERAVEHNLSEIWATDHLEELSAMHDMQASANDVEMGQDETFVEDPRGFNSIFKGLVHEMTSSADSGNCNTAILLNQQVLSIHYAPHEVKVVAKDVASDQETEYQADLVVSTVSLGVLQKGCINFIPPLPRWKSDAFSKIQMFCFAKVYAKFRTSSRLWPQDKDYLAFVTPGEENRGYFPLWMRYQNYNGKSDDNEEEHQLYMCYLGGSQARRVESLDTEQLKDEIEALFGRAFGPSPDCRPVSVAVTDWSRNPRYHGSYSSYPKDALADVTLEDLQRGLSGNDDDNSMDNETTLYFAGEALDNKFNGWIQGAYLSGERVAQTILIDIGATSRAEG